MTIEAVIILYVVLGAVAGFLLDCRRWEMLGILAGMAFVIAAWPVFAGGRAGRAVAAAWHNRNA